MVTNETENGKGECFQLSDGLDFKFVEFNSRRAIRGVEAARVEIIEDGEEYLVWMSKSDILKNMIQFGRHPELEKAYSAYNF